MNPLRTLSIIMALCVSLQLLPVQADVAQSGSGDPAYQLQNPPAYAMLGDLPGRLCLGSDGAQRQQETRQQ
ncbi:hypothetical protein NVV94_25320 [Pseudomonas sp. LS1212]|uniref:hypothetical protein n=1 Tax=Pseudomonas sp. LS1212 TaxID=2972478 RepID=UPI00215D3BE2|nr:hypothetical protein [Pseudomonas sp. LS1212]UVJ43805.1 hypothetical protein NVV94_25320 [Pseudomonas sp. LS1212]